MLKTGVNDTNDTDTMVATTLKVGRSKYLLNIYAISTQCYTAISPLIWNANQWTVLFIMAKLV